MTDPTGKQRFLDAMADVIGQMKKQGPSVSPDRALTPAQKWEVMDRLLRAWLLRPEMRLGQLIVNAIGCHSPEIFYREDFKLVRMVEEMTGGAP